MTEPTLEIQHARSAGLRYVDDRSPGYRRERTRAGFVYVDRHGKRLTDADELARIRSLAIPPAYEDVWICPYAHGHMQATARDARGRKQYRYHKRWREVRDASKFEETLAFAKALPGLRERVERDFSRADMSREYVLATVIRMLETTLVRVGNETYARDNDSYGLTTLRDRHVRVDAGAKRVRLQFRGKSGVDHAVTIDDRRLARAVKRCRDLPGEVLFSYLDDAGESTPVHSEDVNAYLREATGGDFSAKDFRTWAATVTCANELAAQGEAATLADAKRNVVAALETTAKRLGNTPAVCRKAYVHPAILEHYLDERRLDLPMPRAKKASVGLHDNERRVLAFLEAENLRDEASVRVEKLERSVEEAASRRTRPRKPSAARASD
ncbi:MAG: DNA topoisomerase IB [Vulcanimicrobiaceae bacterium]